MLAVLPCIKLLKDQSIEAMLNSMTLSALAFFLFSFQVHEKQCLLFVIPATLLLKKNTLANGLLIHTALFRFSTIFYFEVLTSGVSGNSLVTASNK